MIFTYNSVYYFVIPIIGQSMITVFRSNYVKLYFRMQKIYLKNACLISYIHKSYWKLVKNLKSKLFQIVQTVSNPILQKIINIIIYLCVYI